MKLYIKNMVCDRCKMVVANELIKLKMEAKSVELGEVELADNTDSKLISAFGTSIGQYGFELIEDRTARVISQIKKAVIDYVHYPKEKNIRICKFIATDRGDTRPSSAA